MTETPFLTLAVRFAGDHRADGAAWDADVVEDILDHVGDYAPHVFAWPEWRNALPGRGHILVIPAGSLRSDFPGFANIAGIEDGLRALIVRFAPAHWEDALAQIAEAYGLSPTEAVLAGELADCGDLTAAGERCGLDQAAVRNTLSRLRQKLGARNTPEAASHIVELLFDTEPVAADDRNLARLLGLSDREMAVARRIAEGMPRTQVAHELGMSMAVLKPVLSQVYAHLAIDSASGLASLIAQARVLFEAFGRREDGRLASEPAAQSKLLVGADGRAIGYSTYGPRGGPALAILHSTITCRVPPSRLVQLLARNGWRVVAIDRPGFGETSSANGPGIDAHVDAAAADLSAVAKAEGFDRLVLVSRGAGQMAVALSERLGALVADAVLVNPTPPVARTQVDRGPLGAIKRRFARNPRSIRVMIRVLLRIATPQRLLNAMRRSLAASPPDLAALDDPATVADYLAAAAPLADNLDGYVVENASWAEGWEPLAPCAETRWTVIVGDQFVLHDPRSVRDYFASLLPGASIHRARDAGQMLMYSHPEHVLDILAGIPGAPSAKRRSSFRRS